MEHYSTIEVPATLPLAVLAAFAKEHGYRLRCSSEGVLRIEPRPEADEKEAE